MGRLVARCGVVLIERENVALIERQKDNETYYVSPGGKQEQGESLEETAIREAYEELGLHVAIERLVAFVDLPDRKQYYFAARAISGTFGAGTGDEYDANITHDKGLYRAVWVRLHELDQYDVRPKSLASMLRDHEGLRPEDAANPND